MSEERTAIVLSATLVAQIAKAQGMAQAILERVQALPVSTHAERATAAQHLIQVRGAVKDLDAERLGAARPLREQIEEINRVYNGLADPLRAADEHLEKRILLALAEERAAAELEQRWADALHEDAERATAARIAAEAAAQVATEDVADADTLPEFLARDDAAQAAVEDVHATRAAEDEARIRAAQVPAYVPPPARTVHTTAGSATAKTTWTYRITDPDKVPRPFCKPDPTLLRAAVNRGVRAIEGVVIEPDEGIATRRRP